MSNLGIYRALSKNQNATDILFLPYSTMRPPGNVPYIVDNLWEWKRPDKFSNRRYSAFASPSPKLASAAVGENCEAYKVDLKGDLKKAKIGQLVGWDKISNPTDSKFHPESKSLKKLFIRKLGHEWFGKDIFEKQKVASLWMPCLSKEEVEDCFQSSEELTKIRDEIYDSIQYWDDIVLIEDPDRLPDPEGELFFEYPDGYYLHRL